MIIYPDIETNILLDKLSYIIESEIIPYVILRVNFPKPLSKGEFKLLQIQDKRRRDGTHNKKIEEYSKLELLRKEFEDVLSKYNRNYTTDTNLYYPSYVSSKNDGFTQFNNDLASKLNKNEPFNNDYFNKDSNLKTHPNSPLISFKKENLSINFNEELEKKIINNAIYQNFIISIEKSIRNNDNIKNISSISMMEYSDFENIERKKITIKLLFSTDDFDENIKIWDNIQSETRTILFKKSAELENNKKEQFENLVKKLYFHIELDEEKINDDSM